MFRFIQVFVDNKERILEYLYRFLFGLAIFITILEPILLSIYWKPTLALGKYLGPIAITENILLGVTSIFGIIILKTILFNKSQMNSYRFEIRMKIVIVLGGATFALSYILIFFAWLSNPAPLYIIGVAIAVVFLIVAIVIIGGSIIVLLVTFGAIIPFCGGCIFRQDRISENKESMPLYVKIALIIGGILCVGAMICIITFMILDWETLQTVDKMSFAIITNILNLLSLIHIIVIIITELKNEPDVKISGDNSLLQFRANNISVIQALAFGSSFIVCMAHWKKEKIIPTIILSMLNLGGWILFAGIGIIYAVLWVLAFALCDCPIPTCFNRKKSPGEQNPLIRSADSETSVVNTSLQNLDEEKGLN